MRTVRARHLPSATLLAVALVAPGTLAAKEAGERVGVGFEYAFQLDFPSNRDFDGRAHTFGVYFPVLERLSVGYYVETGDYEGRKNAVTTVVDRYVQELRLHMPIWGNGTQEASLIVGFGSAEYSGDDINDRQIIADVVGRLVLVRGNRRDVNGELALNVGYRYAPIEPVVVFGAGTEEVDNFDGFIVAMNLGFYM